jgi:ribose transport system permease protein
MSAPTRARTLHWSLRRQATAAPAAVLLVVLLVLTAARSSDFFRSAQLASELAAVAPLVLATIGISAIAQAGPSSVDLSVGPLMVFVNVVIVKWLVPAGLDTPLLLPILAMLVAIAFQAILGVLIGRLRLQPVVVTLAGYLVLTGLGLVVLPQPGGDIPIWLANWGSPSTVFSAPLGVLVIALLVWTLLARTTLMRNVRLAGANDRTAYVSGIPLVRARVVSHVVGGAFIGLAGLMLTGLLQSGDATQGSAYTLQAVAALVLGGASLAGGRAGALGALLGALDVYLISFVLGTFDFGAKSSYVIQFSTGIVLFIALVGATVTASVAQLYRRRSRIQEA